MYFSHPLLSVNSTKIVYIDQMIYRVNQYILQFARLILFRSAPMLQVRTIRFAPVAMAATATLLLLFQYTMSIYTYGQDNIIINGAGATFPLPLIDTWREKFQVVDPSVTVNFQPIGSGGE